MSFLTNQHKELINNFIHFVKDEIGIENLPSICVQNNREGIKTTANYDYTNDKKVVRVYGKNRALVDILRSIGHEMVHHKQWEDGRLETKPKDIGGDIEDEANAQAGVFIKKFSKIEPKIYDE